MKTLTYDNPDTFRRECWQDGILIYSYCASMFMMKKKIPAHILFFGANVGDWIEGQFFGDMDAMIKDAPDSEVVINEQG